MAKADVVRPHQRDGRRVAASQIITALVQQVPYPITEVNPTLALGARKSKE